jgi:hypothetical protein
MRFNIVVRAKGARKNWDRLGAPEIVIQCILCNVCNDGTWTRRQPPESYKFPDFDSGGKTCFPNFILQSKHFLARAWRT